MSRHAATRGRLRSIGGAAVAVAVVAAGVGMVNLLGTHPDRGRPSSTAARRATLPATSSSISVAHPRHRRPNRAASLPPGRTAPPTGVAAAAPKPALIVLNDSRITGLAHHAAGVFAAHGWPVSGVGNLPADVWFTTVYYGAGRQGAAQRLLTAGLGIRRALPQSSWPIAWPGGLVVVVTRDFPTW